MNYVFENVEQFAASYADNYRFGDSGIDEHACMMLVVKNKAEEIGFASKSGVVDDDTLLATFGNRETALEAARNLIAEQVNAFAQSLKALLLTSVIACQYSDSTRFLKDYSADNSANEFMKLVFEFLGFDKFLEYLK